MAATLQHATVEQLRRRAATYGVLVAVGLFWLMHLAIQGGKGAIGGHENLPTIDFVRLKKDTDLELRTRKKPPKPEPPKQPPPPKLKVETPPPDAPPMPVAMPKMNLSTQITGGPFLGAYVGGDLSGYSELIPLVRITPQYPRNALRDGIEGTVKLEITVNPDGSVREARVIEARPRGVFESAAVAAALKGKFRPKIEDGKPVQTKGVYEVVFKLEAQ